MRTVETLDPDRVTINTFRVPAKFSLDMCVKRQVLPGFRELYLKGTRKIKRGLIIGS